MHKSLLTLRKFCRKDRKEHKETAYLCDLCDLCDSSSLVAALPRWVHLWLN
jgi:hypothetical protein